MNLHQHRFVSMRQHFDQDANGKPDQSRRSSFSSSADSDIFSQASDSSSLSSLSSASTSQLDFGSQHADKRDALEAYESRSGSLASSTFRDHGTAMLNEENAKLESYAAASERSCLDLPAQFSDLWTEVLQSETPLEQASPLSAQQRSKLAPRRPGTVSPCARRHVFGRRSSLASTLKQARASDFLVPARTPGLAERNARCPQGEPNVGARCAQLDAVPPPNSTPLPANTPPNAPQLSEFSSPDSLSSASSSRSSTSSSAPSAVSTTITTPSSVASWSELSRTNSYGSEAWAAQRCHRAPTAHATLPGDRASCVELTSTHPRRTSISQGWCKPSLTRQDERRQGFVEHLVDAATQLVAAIWPSSSAPAAATPTICAKDHGVYPLRLFIREVLRRSRASYSTLQVALYYLVKIKLAGKLPDCDFTKEQHNDSPSFRALQCGRRMFLASLILASKYLQDRNFSAKAWSKISGLGHTEISMNEMSFLDCIEWSLHIKYEEFQYWSSMVVACTDAAQLGKRCPWRNVITCVSEKMKRQKPGAEFSDPRLARGDFTEQAENDASLNWTSAFMRSARAPLQFEDPESWRQSLEKCFSLKCETEWPSRAHITRAKTCQYVEQNHTLEPWPMVAPAPSKWEGYPDASQNQTPNLASQHASTPAARARVPGCTPLTSRSEFSTPACPERTLPPLLASKRGSFLKMLHHSRSVSSPQQHSRDSGDTSHHSSCPMPSSAPLPVHLATATSLAKDKRACGVAATSEVAKEGPPRPRSQTKRHRCARKLAAAPLSTLSDVAADPLVIGATRTPHRSLLNPGAGVAPTVGCPKRLCSLAEKKRRRAAGDGSETVPKLRRTNTFECRPAPVTPRAFVAHEIYA